MPTLTELGYSYDPALYMGSDRLFYVSIGDAWYDLRMVGSENEATEFVVNRGFVGTRTAVQEAFAPVDSTPEASLAERRARMDALLLKARSPIPAMVLGLPNQPASGR
jgi:hypothetical protein